MGFNGMDGGKGEGNQEGKTLRERGGGGCWSWGKVFLKMVLMFNLYFTSERGTGVVEGLGESCSTRRGC
jgi:hypothetical protein